MKQDSYTKWYSCVKGIPPGRDVANTRGFPHEGKEKGVDGIPIRRGEGFCKLKRGSHPNTLQKTMERFSNEGGVPYKIGKGSHMREDPCDRELTHG